jgi:hypothetical protein
MLARVRQTLPVVLLFVGLAPAMAQSPKDEPLATQQEVRDLYAAGEYQKVLQKLSRLLALKGRAAEPYDQHELWRIKGETHLRQKGAGTSAAQAFGEAAKIAPDGLAAAVNIATELLIKRSTGALNYTPKQKDPKDKTRSLPPINILDPEGRKQGIAALYADELAILEPRVKAAIGARTLSPMIDLLPSVRTVRWLEMASTGVDTNTQQLVAGLGDQARRMMETSIKEMTEDLLPIDRQINEPWQARVPMNDKVTGKVMGFQLKWKRKGPTPQQFTQMQTMFATCGKMYGICDEMGGSYGKTGREFDDIKGKAEQLGARLKRRLDTEWRAAFDNPPPPVE